MVLSKTIMTINQMTPSTRIKVSSHTTVPRYQYGVCIDETSNDNGQVFE
jgi:hypothetical protein